MVAHFISFLRAKVQLFYRICKKIEIIFNQRRHIKCYVLEMQVKNEYYCHFQVAKQDLTNNYNYYLHDSKKSSNFAAKFR